MGKKGLFLLVLVVVLAALVVGCKNETTALPESVTFQYGNSTTGMKLVFKSSSTFTSQSGSASGWVDGGSGSVTYKPMLLDLSGATLYIYTNSSKTASFASYKDLVNATTIFLDGEEIDLTRQ